MHRGLSTANGTLTVILPGGQIRAAFAELTGINVAKGIGLLLKGTEDKAQIRCGVAQFVIRDGVAHAQNVVFDTENVVITGKGEIRLGSEELDLSIKGDPKKVRFTRLRAPVEIKGHLWKPSVGIDAASTAKQGAIAAALGAINPLAAVLAFVDPGLAKDQNCSTLLANAEHNTPHPPPQAAGPTKPDATRPKREAAAGPDSQPRTE